MLSYQSIIEKSKLIDVFILTLAKFQYGIYNKNITSLSTELSDCYNSKSFKGDENG